MNKLVCHKPKEVEVMATTVMWRTRWNIIFLKTYINYDLNISTLKTWK